MTDSSSEKRIWRCEVCGYLHEGTEPPEECPVCGAKANEFELLNQDTPASATSASEKRDTVWRCLVCEYVYEGVNPPEECPVCGAKANEFEPVSKPESISGKVSTDQTGPDNFVIIGGGIAGLTAAESFKEVVDEAKITIINEETGLPYYRLNLTRYLAGEIKPNSLPIRSQEWFRKKNISLFENTSAAQLKTEEQKVLLNDGREISYDRLLLCPGSHPYVPSIPGSQLRGVRTLRTKEDADDILDCAKKGAECAVIGGGVLGIETAGALARQGIKVTLLESHQWLMPRQLNRSAAERLKKHLQKLGVSLREEARTSEFQGTDNGGLAAIVLQSGEEIKSDLAILATGVRPNTALARKAGLEVETGIVVDNHLRASKLNIFAAGDAAEHNGTLYGLWNASQYQGRIAGINAAGADLEFGGLPRNNTLKLAGIEVCSIGQVNAADGSYLDLEEDREDSFFRLVFHDGFIVGAILMDGAAEFSSAVKKAIENRKRFDLVLRHKPRVDNVLQEIIG